MVRNMEIRSCEEWLQDLHIFRLKKILLSQIMIATFQLEYNLKKGYGKKEWDNLLQQLSMAGHFCQLIDVKSLQDNSTWPACHGDNTLQVARGRELNE